MIDRLSPPIRGLIFDMDGVLWKDDEPLADLPAVFARVTERGLKVMYATNNATRSTHFWAEKLGRFGIRAEERQVVNSSLATALALAKEHPGGGPVYVIGERGLIEALAESGFYHSEDGALAVVAGLDRHLTYDKLKRATLLIRGGAPFIGTNPDRTLPTPEGEIPGAGTVLAALEAATGRQPRIIGKPMPALFELALERLGTTPEETLVIGDRIDTDIAGGQAAGCRTALVLSGVTTRAAAQAWSPPPDLIAERLADLFDEGDHAKP